jgi:tetratricopeptide (TPR) repeat protein
MNLQIGRAVTLALAVVLFTGGAFAQEAEENFRDRALALNNVTGETGITNKIRELRKDKDALKKLIEEARALVKDKEKDPPLNYTATYILGRAATLAKDNDASEYFYKLALEHAFRRHSVEKKAQVLEGLIDLFERSKRYDDALFTCDRLIKLGKEDNLDRVVPFTEERKVMILARQKKFDEALKLADTLVEEYGGSWYFVLRKAATLREAGKFEESAAAFNSAVEKIENGDLKEEDQKRYADYCRYQLSNVYVDLNQIDKSVELLEELAKAHPENATYQNDLGYILADHDRRLDDAAKMIEKALELDRAERKKLRDEGVIGADDDVDNSAYLDSLAWVHFKKKNYTKALELMQQVIKAEESQHPEIYDHLGDIHMAMGQKDEAVKAWKKALELENVNYRDDARKKAIRTKIEGQQKDD